MQSPFEAAVKICRRFVQLPGRNGSSARFMLCSRNHVQDYQRNSFGTTNESQGSGGSHGYNNYNRQSREGSLFAFASSSTLLWPVKDGEFQQRRYLWGWLNSIFNRVDESRIKEVGPDRACAEWLLRCGAGVKWDKGPDEYLRDYNSLPVGNYRSLKIIEIDATDSAIMHIGFPHFSGLKSVKKAIFHRCGYMEDEAVRALGYLKDTLEDLQISSCGNVSDEGVLTLVQMKNLKRLKLYDFLEVRDRKKCLAVLQESLPNCEIYFPFAQESDRDPPAPKQETTKV